MKKFRRILYIVYFAFHLVLIVAILYVRNQFSALFSDYAFILYIAIFGMILFFIDVTFDLFIARGYESRIKNLENERNEVKAKLYDRGDSTSSEKLHNSPQQDSEEEQL
jgi:hypothetical protein